MYNMWHSSASWQSLPDGKRRSCSLSDTVPEHVKPQRICLCYLHFILFLHSIISTACIGELHRLNSMREETYKKGCLCILYLNIYIYAITLNKVNQMTSCFLDSKDLCIFACLHSKFSSSHYINSASFLTMHNRFAQREAKRFVLGHLLGVGRRKIELINSCLLTPTWFNKRAWWTAHDSLCPP